jgi:hypothetical protein
VEINRASLPAADRLGEITLSIPITFKIIQSKYDGNKPSKLGEIVNPAVISTYFTKRSAVYFYCISIVFPFIISRSSPRRVFLMYYFTKRSGVYFYCISIVFRLPAAAGISTTHFPLPRAFPNQNP